MIDPSAEMHSRYGIPAKHLWSEVRNAVSHDDYPVGGNRESAAGRSAARQITEPDKSGGGRPTKRFGDSQSPPAALARPSPDYDGSIRRNVGRAAEGSTARKSPSPVKDAALAWRGVTEETTPTLTRIRTRHETGKTETSVSSQVVWILIGMDTAGQINS